MITLSNTLNISYSRIPLHPPPSLRQIPPTQLQLPKREGSERISRLLTPTRMKIKLRSLIRVRKGACLSRGEILLTHLDSQSGQYGVSLS